MRHQFKLKLTKLPYLALANIFRFLNSVDLFNLSIIDKRLMNAISLRHLGNAVCIITIRTTFRKEVSIQITLNGSTLTWKFARAHNQRMAIDGPIGPLTLGKTTLESCARHSVSNTVYTFGVSLDDDSFDSTITTVACYLFSLFSCSVQLEMDQNAYSKVPELFKLSPVKKCVKLSLRADNNTTKEDVEGILAKLGSLKSLDLGCYKGKSIDTGKIANLDSIRLNDAFWLPANSLLQLNGRRIEVTENSFDAKVIRKMVDRWCRGEHEKLEVFTIYYSERNELDLTVLLEEINMHAWSKQRRHRFYRINATLACDCENGIDFMRPDGKLATFLFEKSKMHFLVWNERFPDFSLPAGQYFTQVGIEEAFYEAAYPSPKVFLTNKDVVFDQQRRFEFLTDDEEII